MPVEDVGILPFVHQTSEAEVGDARATSPVDEHVGRFQIAVEYAAIVGRSQTGAELPRQFERLVRWQPSNAPQKRGEILAVHVLHREEVLAVRLADVVDAAHVRMGHLARDADLVMQARQTVRAVGHVFGQELESHRLTELEILGPIHVAHAAAPEEADDPVAAGEHRAGNEPRLVEGFGRGKPIRFDPRERGRVWAAHRRPARRAKVIHPESFALAGGALHKVAVILAPFDARSVQAQASLATPRLILPARPSRDRPRRHATRERERPKCRR